MFCQGTIQLRDLCPELTRLPEELRYKIVEYLTVPEVENLHSAHAHWIGRLGIGRLMANRGREYNKVLVMIRKLLAKEWSTILEGGYLKIRRGSVYINDDNHYQRFQALLRRMGGALEFSEGCPVEMTLDLFNRITLGDRDYWANSMVTTFTDTFKTEGPEANLVLRPTNPRQEDTRILGDIWSFSWRASRLLASGRELSSDDDWGVLEVAFWVTNISQDYDVRNTLCYPNYHTVITFPIVGRRGDVLRVMRAHGHRIPMGAYVRRGRPNQPGRRMATAYGSDVVMPEYILYSASEEGM